MTGCQLVAEAELGRLGLALRAIWALTLIRELLPEACLSSRSPLVLDLAPWQLWSSAFAFGIGLVGTTLRRGTAWNALGWVSLSAVVTLWESAVRVATFTNHAELIAVYLTYCLAIDRMAQAVGATPSPSTVQAARLCCVLPYALVGIERLCNPAFLWGAEGWSQLAEYASGVTWPHSPRVVATVMRVGTFWEMSGLVAILLGGRWWRAWLWSAVAFHLGVALMLGIWFWESMLCFAAWGSRALGKEPTSTS